mmetsp:Transcript_71121/g.201767  ORF Transcript_71121/g.201767 Transcript_71121/m.201767 type:complete len:243 (-) Transcript_71121:53-781(-)
MKKWQKYLMASGSLSMPTRPGTAARSICSRSCCASLHSTTCASEALAFSGAFVKVPGSSSLPPLPSSTSHVSSSGGTSAAMAWLPRAGQYANVMPPPPTSSPRYQPASHVSSPGAASCSEGSKKYAKMVLSLRLFLKTGLLLRSPSPETKLHLLYSPASADATPPIVNTSFFGTRAHSSTVRPALLAASATSFSSESSPRSRCSAPAKTFMTSDSRSASTGTSPRTSPPLGTPKLRHTRTWA